MSGTDGHVLLLYGLDGEQWAKFLSSRLADPKYKIKTVVKELSDSCQPQPPKLPPRPSHLCKGNVRDSDTVNENTIDKEKQDGVEDDIYINSIEDGPMTLQREIQEEIAKSRACVMLLSPDVVELCPFPIDVRCLNPRTTVFLLLGVDDTEARLYFGDQGDAVFQCRICIISDESSTQMAMVQIIDAFEDNGSEDMGEDYVDDADIYSIPPSPKQLNSVQKVFPRRLTETERDVYILLTYVPEDAVRLILDDSPGMSVPLTCVDERLYSFTLPDNLKGKIFFRLECQGHEFGMNSVEAHSNLDLIREVLTKELDPMALIASAMGLSANDLGGVDTALAFRLQQLAPLHTFRTLFPCEDAMNKANSDERSNLAWPSLLHLAADLNLRTLSSELLRFPGMLAAALTENRDGYYPCQLAAKRGYTQLEKDLIEFVRAQQGLCETDSNQEEYVQPLPTIQPPVHRPKKELPHANPDDVHNSVYIDMSECRSPRNPTLAELHNQHSDSGLVESTTGRGRSYRESCTSIQSDYSNLEGIQQSIHGDGHQNQSLELSGCNKSDNWDPFDSPRGSDLSLSPNDSPRGASPKALKMLGIKDADLQRSRSSTIDVASIKTNLFGDETYSAALPPGTHVSKANQLINQYRVSVSSNCDDPFYLDNYYQSQEGKNRKDIGDRIKSFFGKIKGSRRSPSEGDISSVHGISLKKSGSSASNRSSQNEKLAAYKKKKQHSLEPQERDSGSYSDEEKDKASPLPKRNSKTKVFKESSKTMKRRLSTRAQQALNERVENAPTLPKGADRRSSFTSYIQPPS